MSSPGTSRRLLNTSVAKKFFSALTGILLCLYLIAHLIGNLLLWKPLYFNAYAKFLTNLPVLPLIELALLGLFLAHIYAGIRVYRENKAARPQEYAHAKWSREQNEEGHGGPRSRKSLASTTMIFSGIFVLVWTVFHVLQMKYGLFDTTNVGHDLAYRVELAFKNPIVVIIYIVALLLLGMHLNHGVSSAVQSMGVSGYGKFWLWLGRVYTIVIIGGFILIPLIKLVTPVGGPYEVHTATTAVSTQEAH